MCKNAQGTAATLMAAIEPTLKSLLTLEGVAGTPEAQAAITAYDAALAAVQSWKSGTSAQEALEAIGDLQIALNALQSIIPTNALVLLNIILAGVETVIGVLSANAPAPAPMEAAVEPHEETQAMHQAAVVADTTAKVVHLVPSFKRSIWHSPESQYKSTWNKAIDEGKFPQSMKAA